MAQDRWPELCKQYETDDGLPTRSAGHWTEDKLFFWNRYIDITTRAMVGNPNWSAGLFYVDLFSGPGICTLRDSNRRLPGSPLLAAHAPKPFERILVCEKDPKLADACKARLAATPHSSRCEVFQGDCNETIQEVASLIPRGALTLAFIDPTGLDARFETIETLSRRGRVDLLILFADAYDLVRNVALYEQQETNSKLDQVLGPDSRWRERWKRLDNRSGTNVRQLFAEIYKDQLRQHLGYKVFGEKVISCDQRPLYRLIYASKHERGLDFWNKITKKDASGQKEFDW